MHIVVLKCTRCGKMNWNSSNMRKHIATVCKDGDLERMDGIVVVGATDSQTPRIKPGPKPVDLVKYLHGRIAAFSTSGDDERIDYMFSSGLIETLFTTRVEDIPAFFFEHLWSARAIEQFQSLVFHRNAIHEIVSSDVDTGDIVYEVKGTITRNFVKDFAVYALELAYAIAKDSVPSRLPDRIPEARALFQRLTSTVDGMTVRDMIKGSGSHKIAEDTVSKLSHTMKTLCATCFA